MKRTLLAIALFIPLVLSAKPAYKLTLQVDGSSDTILLMGYYHAQHTYIMDTARNNGKGRFVFEGDRELKPGLYFFTNNRDRFVEFVVYHEKPTFQFHTNERAWLESMQVKGSRQNEVYYQYQRASERLYQEMQETKPTMDSAAFVEYRRQQHLRIDSLKLATMKQYPESMFAKMMRACTNVDEHVPTHHPDSTEMSRRERYEWYMQHYFDYMPLDDDFIIRTPKEVFYQRLTDYTDKYMRGMTPEMICPLLDSIIDRAEPAPEVYRWLIETLSEKYLQSNIMVYDEIYVHLVQRYLATGKADWFSPSAIDMNVERANKWERLLVGREAPELILFDTNRYAYSLHRMRGDYTLLLFWSPTCGHCREIIPEIYKVFEQYADTLNLTAFAILSEPDDGTVVKWKKFLADHNMTDRRWVNLNGGEANIDWHDVYDVTTTPQIYLVENKDHTFIAKKLNAKIFNDICKNLLNR